MTRDELEAYRKIDPSLPERIQRMEQREAEHQRRMSAIDRTEARLRVVFVALFGLGVTAVACLLMAWR